MKYRCPLLSSDSCQSRDVLKAIDDELTYINFLADSNYEKWPNRTDKEDHGVAGQLVTLSRYVRKAEDAWADNPGNRAALDELRKCAAIAIRALILYGCPPRTLKFVDGYKNVTD